MFPGGPVDDDVVDTGDSDQDPRGDDPSRRGAVVAVDRGVLVVVVAEIKGVMVVLESTKRLVAVVGSTPGSAWSFSFGVLSR